MNGPPAAATPGPADAEQALSAKVAAAQAKMRRSVTIGRLQGDPLADVVEAMADAIGVQHDLHVAGSAQPIDPGIIARFEAAAAAGVGQRVEQLARAYSRRTALLTGGIFVAAVAVAAVCGYQVGRSSAVNTVLAVQAAAVRDGPEAAEFWARLMSYNDGGTVAASCKSSTAIGTGGRRACVVPAWVEPAANPAPRTGPAPK